MKILATVVLLSGLAAPAALAVSEPWQQAYTGGDAAGKHVLGLWQFASGAPTNDSSAHQHNLKLFGAALGTNGPFGGCLESFRGYPAEDKRHAAVTAANAALSPAGAFTLELWIQPKPDLDGYPEAFLLDKKYVAHTDYQLTLGAADKGGQRRLHAHLGFGDGSEAFTSEPARYEAGAWYHVAFTYDGAGAGRFFRAGAVLGGTDHPGRQGVAAGRHPLSIGDRIGSLYHGFPGRIAQVRVCTGVLEFRPAVLALVSERTSFVRMEKPPLLRVALTNTQRGVLHGAQVTLSLEGLDAKTFSIPDLASGQTHSMDYPFDTTLRPGTYKLTARLELAGAKPFVSEEKFEVVLVPRPLPYRMPVVMWGLYGPESVLRELPRLKEIGFTHSLGLRANCESIWSAGKPIAPDKPENIAAAQRMLNAALASDFGIIASLSPGHELRDHKDLWRVNRDGQPRDAKKPDICALTPGVSNFCYNVGASVAQTYGAFPAFQSALLHTEVRDGANLCFHEHDRAGYRAATGLDIPAEVASKSGVRFDKLKDFPANRVIADDHPLYRYLQWYWKAGDGYNQLNTALHLGLKSTGRADLLEIQKSAHRAASLTDQLLAFSRKQAVALAPLHINKVVNDTQKMVQRLIGEDIRIETNLAPNLPQVRADAGQFQQVLMNLAIHAREAMPHGGRLSIRTDTVVFDEQDMSVMADARPGCFIYLAVTDTGAGMSREELAHVFEPFYNLPDSGKGTGLGLSVVYGIAQQHQGWIHVYSQQGKGTTFKLYLPACPTELGGTDLLPVAPATPPAGRGERILLVEDELAIRQWATRVLRGAGYEVLTADSAAGALTLFRQEEGRFALLFSDIVLPDQSGLEIAEQVRQQQPGLPVLLCSGYTDEHDRWSAIEQQRFHFLQKPYPCAQLLRRIRAILDTASA